MSTSPDMAAMHDQFVADSFSYVRSMLLRCAVDLGIARAIHRLGRPASLADICAAVGVPSSKAAALRRVMRMLVIMGYFSQSDDDCYSVTPVAKHYLVDIDVAPVLHFRTCPAGVDSFRSLAPWLRSTAGAGSPFELEIGKRAWDLASSDPSYNKLFNDAMAAQPASFDFVPEAAPVLRGVRSLVDVGGGTGNTARAIMALYPDMKYTVLDLPHVIEAVPEPNKAGGVTFVPGSMFDSIPTADTVLLKRILHDWDDESCVKILKKCRQAIPSKEEGGKVIIIDIVRSVRSDAVADVYMDLRMLVSVGGVEREEREWKALFQMAGFSGGYIITSISAAAESIIELFP